MGALHTHSEVSSAREIPSAKEDLHWYILVLYFWRVLVVRTSFFITVSAIFIVDRHLPTTDLEKRTATGDHYLSLSGGVHQQRTFSRINPTFQHWKLGSFMHLNPPLENRKGFTTLQLARLNHSLTTKTRNTCNAILILIKLISCCTFSTTGLLISRGVSSHHRTSSFQGTTSSLLPSSSSPSKFAVPYTEVFTRESPHRYLLSSSLWED